MNNDAAGCWLVGALRKKYPGDDEYLSKFEARSATSTRTVLLSCALFEYLFCLPVWMVGLGSLDGWVGSFPADVVDLQEYSVVLVPFEKSIQATSPVEVERYK